MAAAAVTLLGSRAAAAEEARAAGRGRAARGGMRFAAVLSDLDGVLVDSGAAVERVWREWAVSQGLDPDEVGRAIARRARPRR